ncbi:hypothetical protein [Methylobacterium sp. A54F]
MTGEATTDGAGPMPDWSRYAVAHWAGAPAVYHGLTGSGGRTRAFPDLAGAIAFVAGLDGAQRVTTRIDCGGRSYRGPEIDRLLARPDFPRAGA